MVYELTPSTMNGYDYLVDAILELLVRALMSEETPPGRDRDNRVNIVFDMIKKEQASLLRKSTHWVLFSHLASAFWSLQYRTSSQTLA